MENLNSVAFIAKVKEIKPIEGADKIEQVIVEGWSSVSSKGTHKVGDLVLCITTDAVIPEDLATKWGVISYLRKGNRVRTVKLKGVYSECILISSTFGFFQEGKDLMEISGIYKYEPPAIVIQEKNGRKHKYSQNPNFHIYYKFPNQKNTPNMFTKEDDVVITRKIHGTNARYGIVKKTHISLWSKFINFFKRDPWFEYEYVYGSHNVEKGSDTQGFYSTDVWAEIANKYDIKNKLWTFIKTTYDPIDLGSGYIIYGEIYGPGIQGEKYNYGLKDRELVLFDIEYNGHYLCDAYFKTDASILNIPEVPLLYCGKWSKAQQDCYVGGYINDTNVPHEGCVVKHISGDRSKVSKVINPEYHTFSEKHLIPDSH